MSAAFPDIRWPSACCARASLCCWQKMRMAVLLFNTRSHRHYRLIDCKAYFAREIYYDCCRHLRAKGHLLIAAARARRRLISISASSPVYCRCGTAPAAPRRTYSTNEVCMHDTDLCTTMPSCLVTQLNRTAIDSLSKYRGTPSTSEQLLLSPAGPKRRACAATRCGCPGPPRDSTLWTAVLQWPSNQASTFVECAAWQVRSRHAVSCTTRLAC